MNALAARDSKLFLRLRERFFKRESRAESEACREAESAQWGKEKSSPLRIRPSLDRHPPLTPAKGALR